MYGDPWKRRSRLDTITASSPSPVPAIDAPGVDPARAIERIAAGPPPSPFVDLAPPPVTARPPAPITAPSAPMPKPNVDYASPMQPSEQLAPDAPLGDERPLQGRPARMVALVRQAIDSQDFDTALERLRGAGAAIPDRVRNALAEQIRQAQVALQPAPEEAPQPDRNWKAVFKQQYGLDANALGLERESDAGDVVATQVELARQRAAPAAIEIELPDGRIVEFPGTMNPVDMGKAIRANFPEYAQGTGDALWKSVVGGAVRGFGLTFKSLAGMQTMLAQQAAAGVDARTRLMSALEMLAAAPDGDSRDSMFQELRRQAKREIGTGPAYLAYLKNLARARAGRRDWFDIAAEQASTRDLLDSETKTKDRATYRVGTDMDAYADRNLAVFPENAEDFLVQLAGVGGYTLPLLVTAAAGAATGIGATIPGVAAATLLGSGEATERAVESGASERDIGLAAVMGTVPGSVDYAPIDYLLRYVTKAHPAGRVASNFLAEFAKRAVAQGLVEGTTEGVQEFLQNVIVSLTYDPDQDLWENVPEAVKVGFGAGLLFGIPGGAYGAYRERQQRQLDDESAAPEGQVEDLRAAMDGEPTRSEAEGAAVGETEEKAAEQRQEAVDETVAAASVPAAGSRVVVAFPDGERETLTVKGYDIAGNGELRVTLVDDAGDVAYDGSARQVQMRVLRGRGTKAEPVEPQAPEDIDIAAAQAEQPSQAQAKANNYRQGHLTNLLGLDIAIETPAGGTRTGVAPDGTTWSVDLPANYGRIKTTKGADGDQVDIYIGPEPSRSKPVYIIDQIDAETGAWDEHKVVVGVDSETEAEELYLSSFSDDARRRIGGITTMSLPQFQAWIEGGKTTEPLTYEAPEADDAHQRVGFEQAVEPAGETEQASQPETAPEPGRSAPQDIPDRTQQREDAQQEEAVDNVVAFPGGQAPEREAASRPPAVEPGDVSKPAHRMTFADFSESYFGGKWVIARANAKRGIPDGAIRISRKQYDEAAAAWWRAVVAAARAGEKIPARVFQTLTPTQQETLRGIRASLEPTPRGAAPPPGPPASSTNTTPTVQPQRASGAPKSDDAPTPEVVRWTPDQDGGHASARRQPLPRPVAASPADGPYVVPEESGDAWTMEEIAQAAPGDFLATGGGFKLVVARKLKHRDAVEWENALKDQGAEVIKDAPRLKHQNEYSVVVPADPFSEIDLEANKSKVVRARRTGPRKSPGRRFTAEGKAQAGKSHAGFVARLKEIRNQAEAAGTLPEESVTIKWERPTGTTTYTVRGFGATESGVAADDKYGAKAAKRREDFRRWLMEFDLFIQKVERLNQEAQYSIGNGGFGPTPGLADKPPVPVVSVGARFSKLPLRQGQRAARTFLRERYRQRRVTNADTGREIAIGRQGVAKATSVGHAGADLDVLAELPKLLETAVLAESQPDRQDRNNVRAVHTFYGAAAVDGKPHRVRLIVIEAANGDFFYDGHATELEAPDVVATRPSASEGGRPLVGPSGAAINVVDLLRGVNDQRGQPLIAAETGPTPDDRGEQYRAGPQPTPKLTEQKAVLRDVILDIAKRINPAVNVRFVEELFGEGPALVRSGAESTERQEVAGSFVRLANLATVSMNLDRFDPLDSAFHELWHSLEALLTAEEVEALAKAYPARGLMSREEAIAIAFAEWATKRRRRNEARTVIGKAFAKIQDFLRSVAQAFRDSGFKAADEIFEAGYRGEIGRRQYQHAGQNPAVSSLPGDMAADVVQALASVGVKPAEAARMKIEEARQRLLGAEQPAYALGRRKGPDPLGPLRPVYEDLFGPTKRPLWQRAREWINTYADAPRQRLIDRLDAIAKLERSATGAIQDASVSAFRMAQRTQNLQGVMMTVLTKGPLRYNDAEGRFEIDRSFGYGFEDILRPLAERGELDAWELWAVGRRMERLLREGRENLAERVAKARGYSDAAALLRKVKQLGQGKPHFQEAWDRWQRFNGAMLDMAEATGLLSPAIRQAFDHADYIPFYRVLDEAAVATPGGRGRGLANQRGPFKQLRGGEQKLNDPVENMVLNMTYLVDAAFKNQAMRRVRDLAVQTGVMEPHAAAEPIPARIPAANARRALMDAGINVDNLGAAQRRQILSTFQLVPPRAQDVISVMEGGSPQYFQVHDPNLLRALVNLTPTQRGLLYRMLMPLATAPKRLLTTMVTADPAFMLRNAFRDSLSAGVLTGQNRNPIAGFKAAIQLDEDLLDIFAAGGGTVGFYKTTAADARRHIEREFSGRRTPTPKDVWEQWQRVGFASENMNRVAIYRQMRKDGKSVAEAVHEAQDLLNFSTHGDSEIVQFFISVVPFLNARIQGLDRLYRGFTSGAPGSTVGIPLPGDRGMTINKAVLLRGMVVMMASLAYWALVHDDERYQDLQEWDKDLYYHFWIGDKHLKLPKPFEIGALFSTVPERLLNAQAHGESKELGEAMGRMVLQTFAFNPIPQAVLPLYEQAVNRRLFFDTPIVSMSDQRLQETPELQYGAGTSEAARVIADLVPDFLPSPARSPKRIEALVEGYTGTLGTYALAAADAATRVLLDEGEKPARRGAMDRPVLRSFVREGPEFTKWTERFYELRNQAEAIQAGIKRAQDYRDLEHAAALAAEHRPLLRFRRRLNKMAKQLGDLRKQSRQIAMDKEMSGAEKRRRLDKIQVQHNAIVKQVKEIERAIQGADRDE